MRSEGARGVRPLGDLEAAIMDRLWAEQRPMRVRDVVDALAPERQLAYTTVMTVMDILHRKGWLERERDGRAWVYQATGSRSQYTAELMREALSTSEDRGTALAQFVAQMSLADAALLRQALDAASSEAAPTQPPAEKRTRATKPVRS
jgi:predicted transcriptional regulator